ncbi:hypothetical protein K439DRAFT_1619845 [Ramaria rubella]|nr:hypothetical protein K439DRAFT_1619845 [Ramaria rubella]
MEALWKKLTGLSDTKSTTAFGTKGLHGGKKAPTMNLDSLDDGEDADTEVQAQAEAELNEFIKLKRILLGCACPECKDRYCKVNKHGVHIELNALQLSTWSSALALKTYGVTYDKPPPCKIFDEFHARQAECTTPAVAPAAPNLDPANPRNTFAAMMMGLVGMAGIVQQNKAPSFATENPMDTSLDIEYPSILEFFDELVQKYPMRNFIGIAEKLTAQDFYCIDEISGKTQQFFEAEPYGLSQGNARFLVRKLKHAVERAKWELQK